jgi:hypothetical protein
MEGKYLQTSGPEINGSIKFLQVLAENGFTEKVRTSIHFIGY